LDDQGNVTVAQVLRERRRSGVSRREVGSEDAIMSQGAMLVWFSLTALSVVFVAIDIRTTPAHPVLKWAFVILAFFTGPFAAFFYVLGCREPLAGGFWFVMSQSLLAGFVLAYPVNWWLVSHGLKHGMITVRPGQTEAAQSGEHGGQHHRGTRSMASAGAMAAMATLSVAALALGIAIARALGLHAAP
jgi:hypothetical protein